jgi:hypothetical protein
LTFNTARLLELIAAGGQLARNRDSLHARLAQITDEIVGETAAIRALCQPQPPAFPRRGDVFGAGAAGPLMRRYILH